MRSSRIRVAALGLACSCGWPEGLPSDGSYSDDSATSSDSSTSWAPSESTTSDGTTSTSGADDTSSDGGPGFIMPPDGGGKNIECDIWENDCPRGEKCMPWANDGGSSWNATKCTPLARDPGAPGEPCTVVGSGVSGIDDCEAGSMCWDVDAGTEMGVCVAFCMGSKANPTCDDPVTQCKYVGEGTPFMLCLPTCDPLLQDCPKGRGCYGHTNGFDCFPDASGDVGAAGDACEYTSGCDPGLFCAYPAEFPGCDARFGCCTPFCDVNDPKPTCPLLTECVPWYEQDQAPPGFEDVGICLEGP